MSNTFSIDHLQAQYDYFKGKTAEFLRKIRAYDELTISCINAHTRIQKQKRIFVLEIGIGDIVLKQNDTQYAYFVTGRAQYCNVIKFDLEGNPIERTTLSSDTLVVFAPVALRKTIYTNCGMLYEHITQS